jgi:glycosyltransferase involved in cell wall biosynthesis
VSNRLETPARSGVASIVVVALDDHGDIGSYPASLDALEWPAGALEVILVTAPGAALDLPASVVRIEVAPGASRAEAWDAGAEIATGEYLAFLDAAVRPDPGWLTAAVTALRNDATLGAVASKVLDADGSVAFVDAALTFTGEPIFPNAGKPDSSAFSRTAEVLYASPWASVTERQAYRWVGGADALCRGVEHADLGWRYWLSGLHIAYVPQSIVRLVRDVERADHAEIALGGLATLCKNLDDDRLGPALSAALLLADSGATAGGDVVSAFRTMLPRVLEQRERVQSARTVPDDDVLRLFRMPTAAGAYDEAMVESARRVTGVDRLFASRRRIVIATPDVLQAQMAGPAIRAWHMAQILAREHDVELVTTVRCELEHPDFRVRHVDNAELRALNDWADIVIFQGNVMAVHPWLRRSQKVIVTDVYDPFHLEVLEQAKGQDSEGRRDSARVTVEVLNEQLARGDFFLCASDKQRDFWLGQLAGLGRINPVTYDHDENLASLITVVPFGIEDTPPQHTRNALKGVVEGIGPDDKVVLWGGGVYNWFDPITLLHAIDRLRQRIPEVRLFFMGMVHPNPNVPTMQMAAQTRDLAKELGLLGTHVFFNESWVDYEDRQNYLLEADVGVSTHLDHVETAFSFRTRLLDYIWASLPIVATDGDSFADLIQSRELGITVPSGDVEALEHALFELLGDDEQNERCRAAMVTCAPELRWSRALAPIVEFCRQPKRAPDLVDPRQRAMVGDPRAERFWRQRGWRYTLSVIIGHLRHGEHDELVSKVRGRIRALLGS